MKANYTSKKHETYLNELYADIYSLEEVITHLEYLMYRDKGRIKRSTIISAHENHTVGSLIRRADPILFYTSKTDR